MTKHSGGKIVDILLIAAKIQLDIGWERSIFCFSIIADVIIQNLVGIGKYDAGDIHKAGVGSVYHR